MSLSLQKLQRDFLSLAHQEEHEARQLRSDPQFYMTVRNLLLRRQQSRREQAESAGGEAAIVMRGRCQELTAIINDIFPPLHEED